MFYLSKIKACLNNKILSYFRNCLIGGSYQVKISDCAIYRPLYSVDYFTVPESSTDDVLPLRWIPWEVYVMVSLFFFFFFFFVGLWSQSADKLTIHSVPCSPFAGLQHMQQWRVRVFHKFCFKLWSKWMVPEKWSP